MKQTTFCAILLLATGCTSPKKAHTADPLRVGTIVVTPSSDIDAALYVGTIEEARQRNDPYSAEIIRSMIRTLAYKVCRIIARHVETGASDASSRSRNEEYFNQFMGVLARHYMQQRSVGFYAGQLNLTPKYLTTIIRKTSGRTAVQWIDDYVVLEAKNLLKYSTMSIQEISYYLNFPNQSFFGKYFKNHTGMTPTAYRLGK